MAALKRSAGHVAAIAAMVGGSAFGMLPPGRGFGGGWSGYRGNPVHVPVTTGGDRLRTSRRDRRKARAKLLSWKGGR